MNSVKGRDEFMKRLSVILISFCLIVGITTSIKARTVGVVDSAEDDLRLSLEYSYEESDFQEINMDGDSTLNHSFAGIRLEKSIDDNFQVYLTGGQALNEFSDSDVRDGTRFGGGIQYGLNSPGNLEYKLVGSYLEHSSENFESNSNQSFEIVNDWQAGLVINRVMSNVEDYSSINQTHAYMSVLYSGRDVETSEGNSTTEFEYSDYNGLSLTGGVRVKLQQGLALDLEAEAGSTIGGSARINMEL